MKILLLALAGCTLMLCGCGPSAQELAEQSARQQFKQAVAAVKVCTQGSTYQEFREKRLALATCYTANQSAVEPSTIQNLLPLLDATDEMWAWTIKWKTLELPTDNGDGTIGHPWDAMKIITPSVTLKSDFTWQQRRKDPDFYADNYVKRGLTQISDQCDELLK